MPHFYSDRVSWQWAAQLAGLLGGRLLVGRRVKESKQQEPQLAVAAVEADEAWEEALHKHTRGLGPNFFLTDPV